jgi:predicted AlkP superfamily phosphohydrolase/phosphomutase/tetratricopeptide (TPR) repeat protein
MEKKKRKVLLVGWDAADWKLIDKYMADGLMPAIKSVIDRGVRGRIATLDPPLSPMLWTSMATGVRPYKHGVLGFVESDGKGGVRPISSNGRKVDAFWNMFTKEGLKSNVVAWWPSNPVENINGIMVSNQFHQEKMGKEIVEIDDWKVPTGAVYPEELAEELKDLRVHPFEIPGNLVMPFVPRAVELDKKKDKRLNIVAKFLAHSTTVHSVATELVDTTDWDITAVYHDALDHFCHGFMKFHPPRMEGLDEEGYDLFKDVVTGAYIWHDMMLGRLLNQIDDDTTVIICSDHGFHSDHLRPKYIPDVPSGPAIEHAPYGIFVAAGPGIKKGESIHGASILDITPTLLTLFDLPVGRDMDGKPLMGIYENPPEVKYIDSWQDDERFGGELVMQDEDSNEATNEAALQQLIDLGYINDVEVGEGQDAEEASRDYLLKVIKENNFYLAKSYAAGGKYDESLEIMLEIEDRKNPDFRYLIEIVSSAVKTKRFALAKEYLDYIKKEGLFAENFTNLMEAKVHIGLNNPAEALKALEVATSQYPDSVDVLIDLGRMLNVLRQSEKAIEVYSKAIKIDPENAYAHLGYGVAAMALEDYEVALEHLLNSVDRFYHQPLAHLYLGEVLALMKHYEMAKRSFEVVVALAPTLPKPYRWLYDLAEITENEAEIKKYGDILKEINAGERIVITGLPGSQLVDTMEALQDSGKSIFGIHDLLGEELDVLDKEWLDEIDSDLVYVPIGMLGSIPSQYSYRIVYVNDSIDDVSIYLNNRGKLRNDTYNDVMVEALKRQESVARVWLGQQPNLDIMFVNDAKDLKNELFQSFISKQTA